MLIASRQKLCKLLNTPPFFLNDETIEQVATVKSLEVYIDQTVNWECHNVFAKILQAARADNCVEKITQQWHD